MKILFIGLGSIGMRHLKNALAMYPESQAIIFRRPESRPVALDEINPVRVTFSSDLEDCIALKPRFAIVASPAPFHAQHAIPLAAAGINVFIEKPVTATLKDALALAEVVAASGVHSLTAYNLRFYPPLIALKEAINSGLIGTPVSAQAHAGYFLPDWRPETDYRQSVSAQTKLGGGVFYELSHEIDYMAWLFGEAESVTANGANTGTLACDIDDLAEITVKFKSGLLAHIHLDMLQRHYSRGCKVIGSKGTLIWDWGKHSVEFYGPQGARQVLYENPDLDFNSTYVRELSFFVTQMESNLPAHPDIFDGVATLRIVLAAIEAAQTGQRQYL